MAVGLRPQGTPGAFGGHCRDSDMPCIPTHQPISFVRQIPVYDGLVPHLWTGTPDDVGERPRGGLRCRPCFSPGCGCRAGVRSNQQVRQGRHRAQGDEPLPQDAGFAGNVACGRHETSAIVHTASATPMVLGSAHYVTAAG